MREFQVEAAASVRRNEALVVDRMAREPAVGRQAPP